MSEEMALLSGNSKRFQDKVSGDELWRRDGVFWTGRVHVSRVSRIVGIAETGEEMSSVESRMDMTDDRAIIRVFSELLRMDEHLFVEVCWNLAGEVDCIIDDLSCS